MASEKDFKFVLIVVDSNEKTKYFGPFDDGEEALEWGEKHFGSSPHIDYFLTSTTLYSPVEFE
jgi:hypothetical protein